MDEPKAEPILVVQTVKALRAQISAWRRQGLKIALVPTMGALHAGHVSLTELAKANAERVIVSIFVNPAQFAPQEDFDRYPRTLEADRTLLEAAATTDLIFAPARGDMYPEGFAAKLLPGGPALGLETDARPHFFDGVATIVAKLLIQSWPDIAVFGEKDYQQLQVIRQMARDLNLPTRILGGPTKRELDGLALSSRNAYLTASERKVASSLNRIMRRTAQDTANGQDPKSACARAHADLLGAGFDAVDYVEVRDSETLSGALEEKRNWRILVAARLGATRLIDNMGVR